MNTNQIMVHSYGYVFCLCYFSFLCKLVHTYTLIIMRQKFSPTKIIFCSQQIVFPYFASHIMLFQHLLTINVLTLATIVVQKKKLPSSFLKLNLTSRCSNPSRLHVKFEAFIFRISYISVVEFKVFFIGQ